MALNCRGVFIVGAKRTPFCSYGGPYRDLPASHIFAEAAKDAIHSANIKAEIIDNTVVGNVNFLSQCDGGKTPRYCGTYSGVPLDRPALGVSKACGTGLQAVITGTIDILTGSSKVSLVGGTELMSSLPMLVRNVRFGTTLGVKYQMEDHIKKQIIDSYCGLSLEEIAELVAKKYKLSRDEVDQYALQSHLKWKLAHGDNVFCDEITPISVKAKKDIIIDTDQIPRLDLTAQELSIIPPTVDDGTIVTTGNSTVPADGAAALIVADEESVKKHDLTPLARLAGWACVGVQPEQASLGAIPAIQKLLAVTNKKIQDIELLEINETTAIHALATIKELNIDQSKVNVCGGALSLGHPVAATGARMATHLVHQIRKGNSKTAVAASSCGGGQGVALMLEAV
ncbi:PREDICTED: 3-ketoacyl-CoA thiolase, mitochondrial-like [Papilio polytes]|uniref:3-ketoacyl-CoA thiolase, mitochondrial-like n=1 Tax=Papilio polytes TaxID=76194 RepID=UPI000675F966|nr:PREDICTED: 3-ketoacyl-CoA thiolase, mitochondrial-like [Papilio polytes]